MILTKFSSEPRLALRSAVHVQRRLFVRATQDQQPTGNSQSIDSPPSKDAKKVPKKRKYNIKQVLDSFKQLDENAFETIENENLPPQAEAPTTPRRNEVNIEMLPQSLYLKLFGNDRGTGASNQDLSLAKEHLTRNGLLDKVEPALPEINIPMPPLQGKTIEDHFRQIAEQQSGPYRNLVNQMVKSKIPELPASWSSEPGWTKYVTGEAPVAVPFPAEDCLVFDIEECMQSHLGPTLATALSPTAWYSWVSRPLAEVINGAPEPPPKKQLGPLDLINLETNPDCLVPPETSKPKVVVAHNASFDRARLKEQYWLKSSKTRFVDTMSMHVCISGVSSFQKAQLLKKSVSEDDELVAMGLVDKEVWREKSSLNNLNSVHQLYCRAGELDKSTRDLFVTGNLTVVAQNFQEAMRYCASDVRATQEVLAKMFPLYLERFPHPATLAGMLEMSVAYLPVTQAWKKYIDSANRCFEQSETLVKSFLMQAAKQACALLQDEKYKDDPWMWDQDWSVQEMKLKKTPTPGVCQEWDEEDRSDPTAEKFRHLVAQRAFLPARKPHLPGYPAWYRNLCPKPSANGSVESPEPSLISASMHVTPKLLRLTWDGYPLHKTKEQGWGFLIPGRPASMMDSPDDKVPPVERIRRLLPPGDDLSLDKLADEVEKKISKSDYYKMRRNHGVPAPGFYKGAGLHCPEVAIPGVWFHRLPHPGGVTLKVGNPLSKDFVTRLSEGTLKGEGELGKVLEISNAFSYWKNNRQRIESQQVIWLDHESVPKKTQSLLKKSKESSHLGAILPQMVVAGTLTRRAVERTWLTASNAETQRIGSELRSMVHAPPGFHIVGADVDSQELWLAALMGDASFAGIHGATAFGWRTLQGKKADGTDLHSVTAKTAGTSRQNAKIMNYARIYGAGLNFAQQLLKRFSPEMSDAQTRKAATDTLNLTKGKRMFSIPAHSFRILFEKELCSAEPKTDPPGKLLCSSTGDKFGMLSETGEILLTKSELENLRKLEKMGGLHYLASPSSKAKMKWYGGTESAMFNCIEEIANSKTPVTPFLECRLSRALEPGAVGTMNYLTTRVNWVVQSSAVDFLHLMLVNMRWLLGEKADWRFILSFHDEVRYLVPSEKKYEAALALHITNLFTRAFCARRLGIHDLPHSVAFFSAVEVDKALRKDANSECRSPSNPDGLSVTYGIPPGETLDVYQTVQKIGKNVFAEAKKHKKFSIYDYCGIDKKQIY